MKPNAVQQLIDEIALQRELSSSKTFAQILKVFETERAVKVVLEYCDGGTLGHTIR